MSSWIEHNVIKRFRESAETCLRDQADSGANAGLNSIIQRNVNNRLLLRQSGKRFCGQKKCEILSGNHEQHVLQTKDESRVINSSKACISNAGALEMQYYHTRMTRCSSPKSQCCCHRSGQFWPKEERMLHGPEFKTIVVFFVLLGIKYGFIRFANLVQWLHLRGRRQVMC